MTEGGETLTIQVVIQAVAQRRRAGMENRREEFLKTVCQIYMAAVLVVLPLYYIPGNGYDKLGDSKYYLYRNISLICMGICLAVQIIAVVRSCRMENSSSSGMYMRKTGGKIIRWCREHSVVTPSVYMDFAHYCLPSVVLTEGPPGPENGNGTWALSPSA